jgi:hypothetical protein
MESTIYSSCDAMEALIKETSLVKVEKRKRGMVV